MIPPSEAPRNSIIRDRQVSQISLLNRSRNSSFAIPKKSFRNAVQERNTSLFGRGNRSRQTSLIKVTATDRFQSEFKKSFTNPKRNSSILEQSAFNF